MYFCVQYSCMHSCILMRGSGYIRLVVQCKQKCGYRVFLQVLVYGLYSKYPSVSTCTHMHVHVYILCITQILQDNLYDETASRALCTFVLLLVSTVISLTLILNQKVWRLTWQYGWVTCYGMWSNCFWWSMINSTYPVSFQRLFSTMFYKCRNPVLPVVTIALSDDDLEDWFRRVCFL